MKLKSQVVLHLQCRFIMIKIKNLFRDLCFRFQTMDIALTSANRPVLGQTKSGQVLQLSYRVGNGLAQQLELNDFTVVIEYYGLF